MESGLLMVMACLAETVPTADIDVESRAPPPPMLSSLEERARPAWCPRGHPYNTQKLSHNTNIFCKWKWETSPDLHFLIILLAGDIEQNYGPPKYPCPVCHRAYSKRRGAVQCAVSAVALFVSTLLRNLTHKTLHTRLDLPKLPAPNTTLHQ